MYYIVGILLLCTPVFLYKIEGCFHESFKTEEESKISSLCNINSVYPWIFRTYNVTDIKPPNSYTSDGFIKVQDSGVHCLASQYTLRVVQGSELIITYYVPSDDFSIVLIRLLSDDGIEDIALPPPTRSEWSTVKRELNFNRNVELRIFGISTSEEKVMIDSVTYVDRADQFEACVSGGGNGGGNNGDQPIDETDWLTIVIVLSVISGVLLLIIIGCGCYLLGRRTKNITNYPNVRNGEVHTAAPLPYTQPSRPAHINNIPRF